MTYRQYTLSIFSAVLALVVFGGLVHFASAGGGYYAPPQLWSEYQSVKSTGQTGASGSVLYTEQIDTALAYAWNRWTLQENTEDPTCFDDPDDFSSDTCWSGWAAASADLTITVGYDARIYDVATGAVIPSGAGVSPGQRIRLSFTPLSSDNIYWFATGYSLDSPYGEWRDGVTPPPRVYSNNGGILANHVTCEPKDYTSTSFYGYPPPYGGSTYSWDVYNILTMQPPERSFTTPGLSDCEYDESGLEAECTVSGSGTITPEFTFDETYGVFYYRYWDTRDMDYSGSPYNDYNYGGPGCYGNNVALREVIGGADNPYFLNPNGMPDSEVEDEPFEFTVPTQSISYPLTIDASANQAPTAPIISGPVSGTAGEEYEFSFVATDPDNDNLRYGVDWNDDSVVDEWVPSSGHAASGSELDSTHTWLLIGEKSFNVLAQDSKGASSFFSTHTITLAPGLPDLTADTPSVDSGTLEPDSYVRFRGGVLNAGSGDAEETFTNRFQIDQDSYSGPFVADHNVPAMSGGGAFPFLGGTNEVDGLGAGSYTELTSTPIATVEGTHRIRLCADEPDDAVAEVDEDNNCGPIYTFAVGDVPQCSDGLDNDSDGAIDYPADIGCTSGADDDETNPADPNLSLEAQPSTFVTPGGTVDLVWGAGDAAESCTLSGTNGDYWELSGTSGTETSSAIDDTPVNYTLTCEVEGVLFSASVTVGFAPGYEEF